MICKVCWGKGWILNGNYTRIECPACHGTKETDATNEDWFCSLSTEEKADFLANIYPKSVGEALIKISNGDKERWAKWLKEIHHG